MRENFLLKSKNSEHLYFECAKDLPNEQGKSYTVDVYC